MHAALSRLGVLALALLLPACGGGGGGESPDPQVTFPTAGAPLIRITSPATGGVTDATSIEVRGTADPDIGTISRLLLDGRTASSDDGYATWSVTVRVSPGPNAVEVEAVDGNGNSTTQSVELPVVGIDPLLLIPNGIDVDPDTSLAYVVDVRLGEVHVMDPGTGVRTVLSGPDRGAGPGFVSPSSLAVDSGTRSVLVYDISLSAIFQVDLLTGDRTILAANASFPTPNLRQVVAMTLNAAADELLCVSSISGLIRVSLVTGEIEQVAALAQGSRTDFLSPRGVAFDKASGCAIVTESDEQAVLCIDLVSGERKLLSSNSVASGPPFDRPGECVLVPGLGLVVLDGKSLIAVDLVTGDRTPVSTFGVGSGPVFEQARDVSLAGSDLLVVDTMVDGIWRVEISTGDRDLPGSPRVGEGPSLRYSTGLTIDAQGRLFSVVNQGSASMIQSVDLSTGDRRVVSSPIVGEGPLLESPRSIDASLVTGELLVADFGSMLFVVDPETGDREELEFAPDADATSPQAAAWFPGSSERSLFLDTKVQRLAAHDRDSGQVSIVSKLSPAGSVLGLDHDDARAVHATPGRIESVDLTTGVATTVGTTSFDPANGIIVERFFDLAVDSERDLVYFRDSEREQIGVIDLETREVSIVTGAERGSGPPLGIFGTLALTPDGSTVVAYGLFSDALVGIDVETGDRFLLSK